MYIGFDISQTGAHKAGCGYVAHSMAQALLESDPAHRYALYPSFGDFYFDVHMPETNPYPGPHVDYGPRHASLEQAREFWTSPGLEAALGHPDVVHSNNFWCPTQLGTTRLVYTLHDLSFVADPSWTTEANRAACWEGVSRAAQAADWIMAVSHASRDHYLQVFPQFPAERIRVIHPGSRFAETTAAGTPPVSLRDVPPGGFWLSVGTLEPRKNQRGIAQAYAKAIGDGAEPIPLVFAGGHGWMMEEFHDELERLGVRSHVRFTGYVSDDELIWLYRHCLANIYFSRFEGFGLPVLEGMQLGAATIASNATSIPEVAGSAALLLAPDDIDGLANAMRQLQQDPARRRRLSEEGRRQAARFAWKTSATSLLSLYDEALAQPKRRGRETSTLAPGRAHPRKRPIGSELYEHLVRLLRRP